MEKGIILKALAPIQKEMPFRAFLQRELILRCERRPGYSLRSFAKTLQVSPSSLSRILRGQRPVSEVMKNRLGSRLGLRPSELSRLRTEEKQVRSGTSVNSGRVHSYKQLPEDTFAIIADWYHYAILELVRLDDFKSEARWIARKLGITVAEANIAIERLLRVGLLELDENGRWVNESGNHSNVSPDLKAAALRNLQKQVLAKALEAIDGIPVEKRDQSSMTMAIDSSKLEGAIEKITRFRRELCAYLESGDKKDKVYQLSVSLFPLIQEESS